MIEEKIKRALKVQRAIETGDPTDLLKPCKCGHWIKMNGDPCPVCGDGGLAPFGPYTPGDDGADFGRFMNHRFTLSRNLAMVKWK